MKHSKKITIILILMFIITQLIGLFVISVYKTPGNILPYGMNPPEEITPNESIVPILIAFVISISLFFILTKINAERFIRFWFFFVTALALGLTLKAFFLSSEKDFLIINKIPILTEIIPEISIISLIVLIIGFIFAYIKIFRRNIIIHNISELLIYPGIAAVFVSILNVFWMIILLLLISLYDIWAVWHSEFMQKMAKYQINNLKFFTGFFIPYANDKQKIKIKQIKEKYANKSEKILQKQFEKAKIKINLAILGGGDIIFPIITAGVFYVAFGIIPALIISISATIALLWLFVFAQKGKFYPAMPFLTIGMYLGMIINWILISLKLL